jgi:hypothetical protein
MAEARVERRLAAILAADVAGYSRALGQKQTFAPTHVRFTPKSSHQTVQWNVCFGPIADIGTKRASVRIEVGKPRRSSEHAS